MKGSHQSYGLNQELFNRRYFALGGIQAFIRLRLKGKSYKQIGDYFGFTFQRAHQIGSVLEQQGHLPSKADIEKKILKDTVKGVSGE